MRRLTQVLIVLAIPVILTLTNVRLLMTSAFARWEYSKPNFPPPAEVVAQSNTPADAAIVVPIERRQSIVDTTLEYVKGAGDESLIADMTFENGRPVYNQREVRHLTDVRILVGQTTIALAFAGLVILLGVGYLAWTNRGQAAARALVTGSGLTVAFLGFIGVVAALAFRFFFVRFHRIFFEGSTWMFPNTDTLIQVFPEKFWFDASLLIVLLTLLEAAVIGVAALVWLRTRGGRSESEFVGAT